MNDTEKPEKTGISKTRMLVTFAAFYAILSLLLEAYEQRELHTDWAETVQGGAFWGYLGGALVVAVAFFLLRRHWFRNLEGHD